MNQIESDEKTHPADAAGRPRQEANMHAPQPAASKLEHPDKTASIFLGLQRPSTVSDRGQEQKAMAPNFNPAESNALKDGRKQPVAEPDGSGNVDPASQELSRPSEETNIEAEGANEKSTDRIARFHLVDRQKKDGVDENWSFIKTGVDTVGRPDRPVEEPLPPSPGNGKEHDDVAPPQSKQDNVAGDLLTALANRYLIAEGKYFFRDRQQILAFEDSGKRIATVHDDPNVAHSMVDLAKAKGWTTIKLKGSEDFKREVWLSASLRGIEVHGFRPKENDKTRLADLLENGRADKPNIIEQAVPQGRDITGTPHAKESPAKDSASVPQQQPRLGKRQQQELQILKTLLRDRGDSETAVEMTASLASEQLTKNRNYIGKLLDHGAARYEHKEDEQPSYFVVLDTPRGEKTVWGVDLQRAMEEAQVERGADIVLSNAGHHAVTVPRVERANDGRIIGEREWVAAKRNDWEVTTVDSMRDLAAARAVSASLDRSSPQQPDQAELNPGRQLSHIQASKRAPGLPGREPESPMR